MPGVFAYFRSDVRIEIGSAPGGSLAVRSRHRIFRIQMCPPSLNNNGRTEGVALLVPGPEVGTVQIEHNFKGMPSDESPLVPDRWTVHLMAVFVAREDVRVL
jgi:hypothetical protein